MGSGYTFGKNLPNFSGLYTPLPGVRGILSKQQWADETLRKLEKSSKKKLFV